MVGEASLRRLHVAARDHTGRGPAPVDAWDPPLSGDMDVRIDRDGVWHHQGRVIARSSLVRLFSTILRRDADGAYYLVTPVEKWRIKVDDVPFIIIAMAVTGSGRRRRIRLTSNCGDEFDLGKGHELCLKRDHEGFMRPLVTVRGNLVARLSRPVYYELAELAEPDGKGGFGLWAGGEWWPIGEDDRP